MSDTMSSFKPYLFTAYYDWFTDNGITTHLAVDASCKGVKVPLAYVKNNEIVLSIAPAAMHDYQLKSNGIAFKAMFRGVSEDIFVPFKAMIALIAVEANEALPIGAILDSYGSDEETEDNEVKEEEPLFSVESDIQPQEDDKVEEKKEDTKESSAPTFEFVKD